ncbi:uncharacterized protein LOC121800495 [Salvia splendens]|uniref:uncharacterized protein LOC121800495 n=1 Tax=Salvia splendens TaxID=180675 RepID=UPI001C275D03|nr:uncharacterized protein LOC121800495 [Salvia splendens]
MAESNSLFKSKLESIRENKLRSVGGLWASGVIGSLAYNWSRPGKPSVKIIHARLHAQALTLAAIVEYHDHTKSQIREHRYP